MKNIHLKLFYLLIQANCILFLTSCSNLPEVPSEISDLENSSQLKIWGNQGKMAVRLNESSIKKNQRHSSQQPTNYTARYSWQQEHNNFQINLASTFGIGNVVIKQQIIDRVPLVELFKGDQLIDSANNAETLLYNQTQMLLPVSMLRYWILGQPDPEHEFVDIFNTKHESDISSFTQGGWQVDFLKTTKINGYTLPTKIKSISQDFTVVIAINTWSLQ